MMPKMVSMTVSRIRIRHLRLAQVLSIGKRICHWAAAEVKANTRLMRIMVMVMVMVMVITHDQSVNIMSELHHFQS